MDDKTRKADYEKSANEYWRWVLVAEDLLVAINILEEKYKAANKALLTKNAVIAPLEIQVIAPMIYFKAKSIELFYKALFIKQGNFVTKSGKLNFKRHNLIKYAENAEVNLNDEEKRLLNKLTDCLTYWGTYPVPMEYSRWRPNIDEVSGLQPVFVWEEKDNKMYLKLLNSVREKVDLKKDRRLPWSQA